jgi:phospholipid/cholesterol/gamma-HCH transport system substrate-binding protein
MGQVIGTARAPPETLRRRRRDSICCRKEGIIMALPVPNANVRPGNVFETIISGLVIAVAVVFVGFIAMRTGTGHLGSYELRVRLADAGGVKAGSDVRLGGTKIGSVLKLRLDPADYSAVLDVQVRDDLALPVDSMAGISSSTLGEGFLSITPGHADRKIQPGGELGHGARPHGPVGGQVGSKSGG